MADLGLLLLTLLWGTTFTFVKGVLRYSSPGVFLAARFFLAGVVLLAFAIARRDALGKGFFRDGLLLGLAMWAGFELQTVGLSHTTPARSGFLTGLAVLIVPVIAHFFMKRPVKASSWLGVAFAVLGLFLLTRPFHDDIVQSVRWGDALTAGCAIAFALHIVWTAEFAPRHPLVAFTLAQITVTFLGAALLVPLEGPFLLAEGRGVFAATVGFTGVVMTAGAFFVQNWGQRHTTAVRAALIFSLEPVAAALFSHFYGGEPLAPLDWAGGLLIVLGVIAGEVGGALEPRPAPQGT